MDDISNKNKNNKENNRINNLFTHVMFWSNIGLSILIMFDYNFFVGIVYFIFCLLYILDYISYIKDYK